MSHFTVMVSTETPPLSTLSKEAEAEQLAEINRLKQKIAEEPDKLAHRFALRAFIHKTNFGIENAVERLVDEILAPYCECTEDDNYLQFTNAEDEGREAYNSETLPVVQLPNGTLCTTWDSRFSKEYEVYEDKVYKRKCGKLKQRKRTEKAKRIKYWPDYPIKKLYQTFDRYMTEYCGHEYNEEHSAYGWYSNPDATWDWYQIGGRWPYRFLVKEDCQYVVCGEDSYLSDGDGSNRKGPGGYIWVAGARKADIEWTLMKELMLENAKKAFAELETWFITGIQPENASPLSTRTEEGIMGWGEQLYIKDETLSEYIDRKGLDIKVKYPFSTYAYVDPQNGWIGSGDMGWFGVSSNDKDERIWNDTVEKFIDSVSDDHMLVSVDCHI